VLGLGVGISSGGNFLGAIKAQNMLGKDAVVVTVFADDSTKYLSTDYAREEPVKEGFLSTGVTLDKVTLIRKTSGKARYLLPPVPSVRRVSLDTRRRFCAQV
jgi:hypothetical protein